MIIEILHKYVMLNIMEINGYEVTEGEDRHTINLASNKCTCREWDSSGIPCPHAIKALLHKKIDPLSEVHWWYSKEAYMLMYKHKVQPVRGEIFWKVEPHHAMEPPKISKMVGRPRVKRRREKDEARKREGVWSASRRGLLMTCGYSGAYGYNIRNCHMEKEEHNHFFRCDETAQTVEDVHMTASQGSQESEFMFIPTPGLHQSSAQQPNKSSFQPPSTHDEDEDSDPDLGPKVISESETRFRQDK